MANIVITKTQGYICIDFGAYYPTTVDEGYHYFPLRGWQGVCKKKIGTEEGLEFHIQHESSPIMISNSGGLTNFYQVDSVDGAVPSSVDNLKELILTLIQ